MSVFIESSGSLLQARLSSLFTLSGSIYFLWLIFVLGVFASIFFMIGFCTPIIKVVLFVIFASMYHRNPALINGQDQVALMLLFFSNFAPLGNSLSFDNWLISRYFKNNHLQTFRQKRKSVWSWRLMQLSILIIYFFSAISKLTDISWQDGTALYYISLSERWFRFPSIDFLHNQILSIFLTYGGLLIEILFPFLIWFNKTRKIILTGATALHTSIIFLMSRDLVPFNILMLISLILFIKPKDISILNRKFNGLKISSTVVDNNLK